MPNTPNLLSAIQSQILQLIKRSKLIKEMYDFYDYFSSPASSTINGVSVGPMQTPATGNIAPFKRIGKFFCKHILSVPQIWAS